MQKKNLQKSGSEFSTCNQQPFGISRLLPICERNTEAVPVNVESTRVAGKKVNLRGGWGAA